MILALAGGVGGAKLARGLAHILPPLHLTVIVNTGDDFEHLGLTICPDIDSVIYAMAGVNDVKRGWGLAGESWAFMEKLGKLGGETWFNLGDRDLATHIIRTDKLQSATLSEVTAVLAERHGLNQTIAPMSDDKVRSMIVTDEGTLAFQDYFVRRRAEPVFQSIRFEGIQTAKPSAAFRSALDDPALEAIIICPSNPILSIEPILTVPGVRELLERRTVPLVAVSPFIKGRAIKGPAAKIFSELALTVDAVALAEAYRGIVDGLIVDESEAGTDVGEGIALLATDIILSDLAAQKRVAKAALDFARSLRGGSES